MHNPKTKLHMPNMLNEDIITKEEFEFKPLVQFQRPLKFIQRFSILVLVFSIYQLVYNGLSFSYLPSSFNSSMAIISLLSLIFSVFAIIWSTKTLRAEQNKTLLTQDVMDKGHETASRVLFFSMIFRAAASCWLIPNMMAHENYTSQHLMASGFTFDRPQHSAMGTTLNNLALVLPFFEVFSCLSCSYAAWVCLRYIKSPGQMINKLVSIANLALMGSSLALIYHVLTTEQYSQHPLISMLVSEGTLTGLMSVGIITAVMTGFVWLVNFRKWRAPSLLVTGVMSLLVLSLGALTVSSYNNATSVSEFYQDTSDMNTWTFKMLNVHKKDIEAFGCPSKYLPYDQCQNSVLVNRWELSETSDTPINCLNMACSSLLGGLYSSPFFAVSEWGLASLVSGLLVIAGSLYLWKTNYLDTGDRSKKNYGWLGALFAMVIVFSVATAVYTRPYIQEKGLSMTDQLQGNGLVETNEELDKWFGGSGVQMDTDISKKISNLFLFKENRYIRMRLNKDYNRILFTEAGDYSRTYQELVDNLNPHRAELALVKIPLDSRHDALVGIVWLPPSISPLEKVTYLKYYAVDSTDSRSSKLGFPVYVATNKDDLEKNMVLANVFRYRSIFLEDELLEVNEQDLIMQRQEIMTVFAEGVAQFEISPEVSQEIAAMLMNKSNKFLVIGVDGNTINVKARGDWQSSYDDFIKSFSVGENEIGLLYLDVEGQTRLVVVMLINNMLIPDFTKLEQMGVYFYIITNPEDLQLDALMSGKGSIADIQRQIQKSNPQFRTTTPAQIMRQRLQLNLLEETGPDLGLEIFKMIADQSSKYLLQRYNEADKKVELVSRGDWSNSNYTTFINLVNPNDAQVGFIYLDLEDDQSLVLFIYAPESKYSDPKQVFKMFNLPSDPRRLESIGVHVYIARNPEALKIENLLKSIFGDEERITTLMQLMGIDNEPQLLYSNIQLRMLADDGTSDDISSSTSNEFINTMIQKTYKYIILKQNPDTNQTVISKTGDWTHTFANFVNDFDRGQTQIGLVHIKLETITKLVLVIFTPPFSGKSDHEVLTQFNFPIAMAEFKKLGVNLFSVQNKADLTVKRIVRSIYTNGPAVVNLLERLLETDDEDDESASYTSFCATCGGNRRPGPSVPRRADDPQTVFALDTEQMDEIVRDDDELTMKLVAKQQQLDTEQMEEIIRDRDEFKTKLLDTEQMEEVIRDRDEITMALFGKMGLKLSRDIVKPIKSKKVKYIILKKDPANKGKPYIASNGTWFATFDQFVREFEPNTAQVGFIYLEIEGQAKLVMVVYAPDPNVDAKQVIKDFKVTKKDAAKLKKKGIFTFVVNNLTNLTLDNAMNSVYSQENQPIIKLMLLMQEYTAEPSLMYDLNLDDVISGREQSQMNMLFGFGSKGLKFSRDIRKMALGTDSKYAIVLINNETGEANVTKQGTWHATFDQFARDFNPLQNQVGFIHLEIEQEKKLAMVVYAPNAGNKTDDEIIKELGIAKNVQKVENNDISVYFARNIGQITLDKVLNKMFNTRNPGAPVVSTAITQNTVQLGLPSDIADALQNQKYKYVILKHDNKKDITTIQTSGAWGSEYKRFVKDFSGKKDQVAFINIDIESKNYLVLVVNAYSYPPSQVLRTFGLPQDEASLKRAGIQVYVARKKKDLGVLNVLQGVYSGDTFNQADPLFMSLFEQSDLPLGKDVVDALTNKKYKYMILKHDVKTDVTTVESTGAWNSTYKAFIKDFTKKDRQIGFIFLEAEAKEILVLVVLAPKVAGTQVLREFGISDDITTLNKLGIKPYIAHKKKELDLDKVLAGVYSSDAFTNNNPAMFISDDEDIDEDVF